MGQYICNHPSDGHDILRSGGNFQKHLQSRVPFEP